MRFQGNRSLANSLVSGPPDTSLLGGLWVPAYHRSRAGGHPLAFLFLEPWPAHSRGVTSLLVEPAKGTEPPQQRMLAVAQPGKLARVSCNDQGIAPSSERRRLPGLHGKRDPACGGELEERFGKPAAGRLPAWRRRGIHCRHVLPLAFLRDRETPGRKIASVVGRRPQKARATEGPMARAGRCLPTSLRGTPSSDVRRQTSTIRSG